MVSHKPQKGRHLGGKGREERAGWTKEREATDIKYIRLTKEKEERLKEDCLSSNSNY